MRHSRLTKAAITAAACATVGVVAGIAGSAAAPTRSPGSHDAFFAATSGGQVIAPPGGAAPPGVVAFKMDLGGPPVHAVETVPNKAGDGFDTVTRDSGTVKSISGNSLTITEGTDKATYATPSLTLPAGATVERNLQKAAVTDIQTGDHVDARSSSDGTTNVLAFDSQHWPPKPPAFPKGGGPPPPPGGATARAGVDHGYSVR